MKRWYDIWFLKYKEQHNEIFVIWAIFFCPFSHLTTQKVKILKLEKYYHFTQVYHKWQSYDVRFLRYGAWQTKCFVILDHFLPTYHLKTWKMKIWKNEKNTLRNHILHKCTKNHDHMLQCSWDTMRDVRNWTCSKKSSLFCKSVTLVSSITFGLLKVLLK